VTTLGLHHVSIDVTDVGAAVRFYVDHLGLVELERPDIGVPGAWLGAGGQQVHLLSVERVEPSPSAHLALHVDDIDGLVAALTDAGVRVRGPKAIGGAARQAFLHDPDRNLVELHERLDS
jgi:catechol 2,3-dioxygenase-like lactoylglutathione lyase family enzyme